MHVLQQANHPLITATHSVISMIRSAIVGLDDRDRAGCVIDDVVADASQEHPLELSQASASYDQAAQGRVADSLA